MMSAAEVFALIDAISKPLAAERIALENALGRVLREAVLTDTDLPAFTRSAMDGYLVRENEPASELVVTGEVRPGTVAATPKPGSCLRVFTGSAVPDLDTVVVMQEDVVRNGPRIRVPVLPDRRHIRQRGSHAPAGTVLAEPGRTIDPGMVALLASCGHASPLVSPLPRVAHIATGAELVDASQSPANGQIRDSNSPMLHALVRQSGAARVYHRRIDETPELLEHALKDAIDANAAIILVSGGAAAGDHDHTRSCLQNVGFNIRVDGVNNRPGKPMLLATRGETIAFGLPGNPLSHFVCYHLFVRRLLDRLNGSKPTQTIRIAPIFDDALLQPNPRESWWPCVFVHKVDTVFARPLPWHDSSDILSLAAVEGLLRVPASGFDPDGRTEVLPVNVPPISFPSQ